KTIKNPTETIGHNTSETTDVGSRILNDILDTGLDGVGKVGESIEDAAEPLADNVTVGGGVNVDSNGNTNLTDGEGNIVDRKPTDPSDMTSDSFDWESAIVFSKAHELNEFLKSEEFKENSKFRQEDKAILNLMAQNHLDALKELSNKNMNQENAKMLTDDIASLQSVLLDFANGSANEYEILQSLSAFKRKYEMLRTPAMGAGGIIGIGTVLAGIIYPTLKWINTLIEVNRSVERIEGIMKQLDKVKYTNPHAIELSRKLENLAFKNIKYLADSSVDYYKSLYSVIIKSKIPGSDEISGPKELAEYLLKEGVREEVIDVLDKISKEQVK
ncbi:MAG: hypothetical protein OEY33_06860, partial [Bdellovibrionales bacterium]|nr:hypothetical protein [Bdellovibrionales bacterium]